MIFYSVLCFDAETNVMLVAQSFVVLSCVCNNHQSCNNHREVK